MLFKKSNHPESVEDHIKCGFRERSLLKCTGGWRNSQILHSNLAPPPILRFKKLSWRGFTSLPHPDEFKLKKKTWNCDPIPKAFDLFLHAIAHGWPDLHAFDGHLTKDINFDSWEYELYGMQSQNICMISRIICIMSVKMPEYWCTPRASRCFVWQSQKCKRTNRQTEATKCIISLLRSWW